MKSGRFFIVLHCVFIAVFWKVAQNQTILHNYVSVNASWYNMTYIHIVFSNTSLSASCHEVISVVERLYKFDADE